MQFWKISTNEAPRCALRRLQHRDQVLLLGVDGAGDEAGAGAQRELHRRHRILHRTAGRRRAPRADPRRGRILPLGQAVDLVVEQQDLQVDVAPKHVQHVVAADRQAVTVAGDHPDVELRVGHLHPGGDRRRPAVDRVEAVGRHVVGEARRAADAGDEHRLLRPRADVGQRLLDRLEDGVVAAAGAPADLLVRGKVAGLQRRGGGDDVHAVCSSRSRIACWISSILKGRPVTLVRDSAASR